jgi:predicted rRNA methylase YqxC with S4 and FtsJ domains
MGNAGLTVKGVIESPILGTHGNREFLMWAVKQ